MEYSAIFNKCKTINCSFILIQRVLSHHFGGRLMFGSFAGHGDGAVQIPFLARSLLLLQGFKGEKANKKHHLGSREKERGSKHQWGSQGTGRHVLLFTF